MDIWEGQAVHTERNRSSRPALIDWAATRTDVRASAGLVYGFSGGQILFPSPESSAEAGRSGADRKPPLAGLTDDFADGWGLAGLLGTRLEEAVETTIAWPVAWSIKNSEDLS